MPDSDSDIGFQIIQLEEKGDVEGLLRVLEHSKDKNVTKVAILALGRLRAESALKLINEPGVSANG